MKLFVLLLTLLLVGCANHNTVPESKTPPVSLQLEAPSTTPPPRKVFKGKDWELTVEDDGWQKTYAEGTTLALLNITHRMMVIFDRRVFAGTLDEYVSEQEADIRKDVEWKKEEVIFAGHRSYKYDMLTKRSRTWAWAVVVNGKGYFLICNSSLSLAEENQETCEDISKHVVVFKPAEK